MNQASNLKSTTSSITNSGEQVSSATESVKSEIQKLNSEIIHQTEQMSILNTKNDKLKEELETEKRTVSILRESLEESHQSARELESLLRTEFGALDVQSHLPSLIERLKLEIAAGKPGMSVEKAAAIFTKIGWNYRGNPFTNGVITKEDVQNMIPIKSEILAFAGDNIYILDKYCQMVDEELTQLISTLLERN